MIRTHNINTTQPIITLMATSKWAYIVIVTTHKIITHSVAYAESTPNGSITLTFDRMVHRQVVAFSMNARIYSSSMFYHANVDVVLIYAYTFRLIYIMVRGNALHTCLFYLLHY